MAAVTARAAIPGYLFVEADWAKIHHLDARRPVVPDPAFNAAFLAYMETIRGALTAGIGTWLISYPMKCSTGYLP